MQVDALTTPERLSQAGKDFQRGDRTKEWKLRMLQSPLDRLYARDVIEPRQYDAGARLYAHWYYSGQSPVGAIDYGRSIGGMPDFTHMPKTVRQAYHRREFRAALDALKRHSGVLMAVVIDEVDPATYGQGAFGRRNEGQARAAAIEVLKVALDCAADHWGM